MSKFFASAPRANQSQKNRPAPNVQHGVTGPAGVLWPFEAFDDLGDQTAVAIIRFCFLDGNSTPNKRESVRSVIQKSQKLPHSDFVTWEECANVKFLEVAPSEARVQITFESNDGSSVGYWSALGTEALNPDKYLPGRPTMWLLGLPNEYPPSEKSRRHILHEFGHVLGLEREHQSPGPAREGWLPKLDEFTIRQQHRGGETAARLDFLDEVKRPTNYTRVDPESIMLYEIPEAWQKCKSRKEIPVPVKLSALDQAFIRLMYPPDLSKPKNLDLFCEAMISAGIPEVTAGRMLGEFGANTAGTLVDRLTTVREYFNSHKQNSLRLWQNDTVARMIDPASLLERPDVNGMIKEVSKDKLFKAIVKNIVYRGVQQYGIPIRVSVPGSTQNEVMKMFATLAMHDDFGRLINHCDSQLSTMTPSRPV